LVFFDKRIYLFLSQRIYFNRGSTNISIPSGYHEKPIYHNAIILGSLTMVVSTKGIDCSMSGFEISGNVSHKDDVIGGFLLVAGSDAIF